MFASTRPAVLGLLVLLLAAAPVAAQPTPEEGAARQNAARQNAAQSAAREWIRPEEVPARADALLRGLERATPPAETRAWLERIETSLPHLGRDLDAVLARAAAAVEQSALPADLEDIQRELTGVAAPLARWKEELAAEATRVADVLDLIAQNERVWAETRGRSETAAAGNVVVRRVDISLDKLKEASAELRTWRARVLGAGDRVIERAAAVDASVAKLAAASVAERASLFVPDRPPLWSRGLGSQIRTELPRAPGEILAYAESSAGYVARDPRPLVVQALAAALLMFGLGRFCSRALTRLAGEQAASRAARLLERPYAIGLLLALIATPAFHPLAPRRFTQLGALLALFPAARIVRHVSQRLHLIAVAGLFILLLLDRLGLALQPLPTLARMTFLAAPAIGLGLAYWLSRRIEREGAPPWQRRATKFAMLGLALALLAEIGGWTNLATLLGRGILAGAIAALYVYAALIALAALLAYALASRTARRSHLIGRNTALLQRRAASGLRWLAALVWLYFMATALGLRSVAADVVAGLMGAGFSIGALSLSVGGVLAFVLTLIVALSLARLVPRVLEEDVYPRAHLPRGVPYALSTLVRYGFYALGFLLALGAAGVRLDQVAILLGGLGIGIGLGLQDLVKNFAAGLTLLFERRVHVGDALEMSSQGILGRVVSIGTRASVIRAWNGAEVVVPNADLISSAVTNWTLSDSLCRIEVPVGVAYGADPERVIALLLDAVRSNAQLLSEPAPQAFFKGFGESSLDFVVRAWTDQGYEQVLPLTSAVGLAVYRNLSAAGISIPFPQRDVHLESVSPAARAALLNVEDKD
jgi:small-conductance mechanosensitive channel